MQESSKPMIGIGRRKALKALGTASVVGFAGIASGSKSQNGSPVVRLEGSYQSPISEAEIEEVSSRLEQRTGNSRAHSEAKAESNHPDHMEIVEYVGRLDRDGHLHQYFGIAAEGQDYDVHQDADQKEGEFEAVGDSVITPDISVGRDWDHILDNQTYLSEHWGQMNHNYDWYRIDNDTEENHGIRTRVSLVDDTIAPYNRAVFATHDWGENEFGSAPSLHTAEPDTRDSSGYTEVSIGIPPSAELSWGFDSGGNLIQQVDNTVPKVDWVSDAGSGTTWLEPGTHFVTDTPCGVGSGDRDQLVQLDAETMWGSLYDLSHTWNLYWTC